MYLNEIEIGDRVWSPVYGYGTVEKIENESELKYPIIVDFIKAKKEQLETEKRSISYNYDGKEDESEVYPTLFFDIPDYKNKIWPKRPRWRANIGERYYYILANGKISNEREDADIYNNRMFLIGNYFKTREKAEKSELYKVFHRYEEENKGE